MGLTETIEQSNDQQLCIRMCPMEQRKERTYIKRPLCLFLSFFFLCTCGYLAFDGVHTYIHIGYRRTFIFNHISFLFKLTNLIINDYSSFTTEFKYIYT
jgi:hypothetical protein